MTINIIEHLINLKIYDDYINSKLDSIEMFWEQIDKGKSFKENNNTTAFGFTLADHTPSEKELLKQSEKNERNENIDLSEQYVNSIKSKIETRLDYDFAIIPNQVEISELYEKVIEENHHLFEYLNTSKETFNNYIQILENELPQNFIKKLSQYDKDNLSKQKVVNIDSSKNDIQLGYNVQDWAAIFCYAYPFTIGTKDGFKSKNLSKFMEKHNIPKKSFNYLRGKCFKVNKAIDLDFSFPVEILEETIKPFLKTHYPHTLFNVDEDIQIIKNESPDY
tara:strand:- start:3195 stop:4028 length:834 start_codon:yes stop_codon:yes gene_type:complete